MNTETKALPFFARELLIANCAFLLGILAPFVCGSTAIPAIIFAQIARHRQRSSPTTQGKRRAAIGLYFAYFSIFLFIAMLFHD